MLDADSRICCFCAESGLRRVENSFTMAVGNSKLSTTKDFLAMMHYIGKMETMLQGSGWQDV